MKNFFTLLLVSAAFTAEAQYIPNGSFENWKGGAGSTYQSSDGSLSGGSSALGLRQRPGDEPSDWQGSSINQKVWVEKKETLIEQSTGYSGSGVRMQNKYVGAMGIGSNAPGFINFGTPWVYAISNVSNCDGGVYGGIPFAHRPDAIRGWFNRSTNNGETARIIVYLWNGTFKSNIRSSAAEDIKDDVDRAVMGKETGLLQSGTLVASCDYSFASTNGWEEIIVPLEYKNDEIPEKLNIIISAGDYWTRTNVQDGSLLLADDVQFVYYSELSSLVYDGYDYFENGKDTYIIDTEYDANKLSLASNGRGATIEKSFDESNCVLAITVKGNDYAADNSNVHTYKVYFAKGGEVVEPNPDPAPGDVDYTPTYTGVKTRDNRWITGIELFSNTASDANVLVVNNTADLCYNDYTGSTVMKAYAGETVTVNVNNAGDSWIHAFLYIDSDADGFTANIASESNYKPEGDLLSYSFYNNDGSSDEHGWNSVGTAISGTYRATLFLPEFTVPSEPGTYRVRVKTDWCNIDPAGDKDGKFGDFMDNGGQIVDFMLEVVENDEVIPDPDPEPEPEVDYTPTNTGTRTYTERNITAVKLSSPLHGESVYELSSSEQLNEYLDLTGGVTFLAAPGEEIVVDVVTGGSWVNHYVYIDFSVDGFTASIAPGSNYIPAEDLVSYSLYNNGGSSDDTGCYNSVGESITGNDRSNPEIPSFTLAAEPGLYRMRIKQDWCSIDPDGDSDPNFGGTFSSYGGQIIDLMLNVSVGDNTGIENVETESAEENAVFDLAGRRIERIIAPGVYIINGKKIVIR